ncbi:phospholipase domain-containing protein [Cryobacterium tagatosivorans]|uniref:phospholipase domain-containing protein n=1 Tax=Cryobacterium tagatosivorans TaxID=1259199 RepID=UPI001F545692|nr:phospholipase domain-containing protein [Cryobacterium tagatosivorans]
MIRFLERWTGVREPNISAWRRTVCGDLTSVFDFTKAGTQPEVDHPGPVPAAIARWHPTPPTAQAAPIQESGTRPARPLPYRPQVSARAHPAGVTMALKNTGSRSTHFTLYSYAGEYAVPQHFDVQKRLSVDVPVKNGKFDLAVSGPNGFQYELAGTSAGPAVGVDASITDDREAGDVELAVSNTGSVAVTLTFTSLQYVSHAHTQVLRPGQRKKLSWPALNGWYDVEISTPEDTSFRRRLTGRVEDGRPGITG